MLATISYLRPAVIIATIIRGNYQIIARDNQYGIIFKDFLNKSFKAKQQNLWFHHGSRSRSGQASECKETPWHSVYEFDWSFGVVGLNFTFCFGFRLNNYYKEKISLF